MKTLDDGIDRANNVNLTLYKVLSFHYYTDDLNIRLPDKNQELLDRPNILDFIEMQKSKSPTSSLKLTKSSSSSYKKPSIEKVSDNIDLINTKTSPNRYNLAL
jgi:hypothetical protein